jgi:uroporphyrinogen decarboxylase
MAPVPGDSELEGSDASTAPFLRACRRQEVPFTPIWLMRQAGRYMPEYRAVRSKHAFLEMCKNPDAAAEVTVRAVERLGVDAAIIFADILLIVEPLGFDLEFSEGDGPVIHDPVHSVADVDRLTEVDVAELDFVYEAVRRAKAALKVPLIGFAGAPFTLASYIIEGGGSRHYVRTKRFMYDEPEAWHTLLRRLTEAVSAYLNEQIKAGADAVQLFDSWVGCLAPEDYRRFVLPHVKRLIDEVTPGTPVIHFGTGTSGLLALMREAGGDVIGLDWRIDLAAGWQRLGDVGVQGNLDPVLLFAPRDELRDRTAAILEAAGGRPGHVFNLGHGILPETPVDNVVALVDMVHEMSSR